MSSFYFHYNKPASKKAGTPKITLHYRGRCLLLDNINLDVPTFGRIRKSQPFFVMAGNAKSIKIINRIAHIT